ncbi:MAG: type II secretion system F family protein [Hominimerdicola sp.]
MSKEKKEKKQKKQKKQREPEYCMSAVNTRVLNYREYYLSAKEKIIYFTLAFVVGALAAYLFYGGLGSDADGNPTKITYILNVIIMSVAGLICGIKFLPARSKQLQVKRRNKLRRQFMDLLDSLASSVSSGNNANNAFISSRNDLLSQYDENAMIVKELDIIIAGMVNGIGIEDMIYDLGKRSGIKEIMNFAQVFKLSYRRGGDFGRIIRESYDMLYNKIQIEMEIETKITSTKNELNMMCFMPILLVGMIKMSGGDFANNFHTATGVLATTVGVVIFFIAYKIGKVITNIEV